MAWQWFLADSLCQCAQQPCQACVQGLLPGQSLGQGPGDPGLRRGRQFAHQLQLIARPHYFHPVTGRQLGLANGGLDKKRLAANVQQKVCAVAALTVDDLCDPGQGCFPVFQL